MCEQFIVSFFYNLNDSPTALVKGLNLIRAGSYLQGGPAKVKPTYIFAGNVWYLNVKIKFNGFLANVITV